MNIGITTFTYFPNKDGVAEACRVMAESLSDLGWEITVYTSGKISNDWEIVNGVTVRSYELLGDRVGNMAGCAEAKRYVKDVLSGKHDVLVIQCWDSWNSILLIPHLQTLSCPLVYISHGYGRHIYAFSKSLSIGIWNWMKWLWWSLSKLPKLMNAGRKLVFLSNRKDFGRFIDHHMANILKHPGITMIPNSFDEKEFDVDRGHFRARYGLSKDVTIFLSVANYSERKNQILALEAFHDTTFSNAVLIFIGSEFNEYFSKLQKVHDLRCQGVAAGNVIFLQGISRSETIQAYVDSNCFVLSAKAETQPIVLLEAMGAGIPWISTDTGCVQEMPGGVVVNSKKSMTIAMQRIATDRNYATAIVGKDKAEQISKFTRSSVVSSIHILLQDCIPNTTNSSIKP